MNFMGRPHRPLSLQEKCFHPIPSFCAFFDPSSPGYIKSTISWSRDHAVLHHPAVRFYRGLVANQELFLKRRKLYAKGSVALLKTLGIVTVKLSWELALDSLHIPVCATDNSGSIGPMGHSDMVGRVAWTSRQP